MCNDNVAFLTQKLFSSDDFSIISYEQEKTQVAFTEKPQIKINSLKKQKRGYIIHTWSDKALKFH